VSHAEAVRAQFGAAPPARLGVAVSGGSDSLALLHVLHDWHAGGGPLPRAATVDHGLRPEAGEEAAQVARLCAGLGIGHDTLRWQGTAARGNLADAARRARYRLLAGWARRHGIADVAIGHTADDLAETFLMRLARGSGLDGLAAMRDRWQEGGVTFHRPLLALRREALRDLLRARGVAWADDPTNDDPAYARTRARAALAAMAPLDIGTDTLAATALRLRDARAALGHCARRAAQDIAREHGGDLLWRRDGFADLPDEIARRLLVAGLAWLNGRDYPPRGAAMAALLGAARAGRRMTLQGCVLSASGDHLRLAREYRAILQQIESQRLFVDQQRVFLRSQQNEIESLNEQIGRVDNVKVELLPMMRQMVVNLRNFIDLDLPFQLSERIERVERLEETLNDAEITEAERYRVILNAYEIEMAYGRGIDAYEGPLEEGGADTVDFLRLGRMMLIYRTKDGNDFGYWDRESGSWQPLQGDYNLELQKAFRIANDAAAPELLLSPVPGPVMGTMEEAEFVPAAAPPRPASAPPAAPADVAPPPAAPVGDDAEEAEAADDAEAEAEE